MDAGAGAGALGQGGINTTRSEVGDLSDDRCSCHPSECTSCSSRPSVSSHGRQGPVNFFPPWVGWGSLCTQGLCFCITAAVVLMKKRAGGGFGRPPRPSSALLSGAGVWPSTQHCSTSLLVERAIAPVEVECPCSNPQNQGMLVSWQMRLCRWD